MARFLRKSKSKAAKDDKQKNAMSGHSQEGFYENARKQKTKY